MTNALVFTALQIRRIQLLFEAIAQLEELIGHYTIDKPGPAYVTCNHVKVVDKAVTDIPIDRAIMIEALRAQVAVYKNTLYNVYNITYHAS